MNAARNPHATGAGLFGLVRVPGLLERLGPRLHGRVQPGWAWMLSVMFVGVCLEGAPAQLNPEYTFRIRGPCGQTVEGAPGSVYDDGTGGGPEFEPRPPVAVPFPAPGYTWDIVLRKEGSPQSPVSSHTDGWATGVATEGPFRIESVTLEPSFKIHPLAFSAWWALTGPPSGEGDQSEENRGAAFTFVKKFEDSSITDGDWTIARIRVAATFPDESGALSVGRVSFACRSWRFTVPACPTVKGIEESITPDTGNPPLALEDCVVYLKAVDVARFIRCDPNADGRLEISDAIWIVQELFLGGPETACPVAADCDADGERNVTDAIYALNYVFFGGPPPPFPFPECGRVEGLGPEDCPLETTSCPLLGR